jgi:hypothetical protein
MQRLFGRAKRRTTQIGGGMYGEPFGSGPVTLITLSSPWSLSDSIALPHVNQPTGEFTKSHVVNVLYSSNIHQSYRQPRGRKRGQEGLIESTSVSVTPLLALIAENCRMNVQTHPPDGVHFAINHQILNDPSPDSPPLEQGRSSSAVKSHYPLTRTRNSSQALRLQRSLLN